MIFKKGDRNDKLTWRRHKLDGEEVISITCECGVSGPLLDHTVDKDGKVTPSIVCTSCDFHKFIQLEGV